MDHDPRDRTLANRRTYLRGVTALSLVAAGGCIGRTRNLIGRDPPERVSLSIKTTPADEDPHAIRIAQRLSSNLRAVGIGAEVIPMRTDELLRDLLVNHDFDLYVALHPGVSDPDRLYALLHSRFNTESGWQNPFGFSDLTVDDLLAEQRIQTGARRRKTVAELQRAIARTQPFTVIAVPDAIATVRRGRYDGWTDRGLSSPLSYLALRGRDDSEETDAARPSSDREGTLRVTYVDRRITRNLNPIAPEFRGRGIVTGLLYDPLLRRHGGEILPWLAKSVRWTGSEQEDRRTAIVELREGVRWHDGRPIDAEDVAFTYRFLSDTSIDGDETVPAPRFRGRVSLVDAIQPVDDRRVRIRVETANRAIAARALTVPILPTHEWGPRREPAEIVGLDSTGETPEALVWNNMDPIGSGPLRFGRAITDETLILQRFDDHFLHRGAVAELPEPIDGGVGFDRVVFRIVPSDAAAVELIAAGEADATGTNVNAAVVSKIVRTHPLRLLVRPSAGFYHVGYNVRRAPLSNPRFRRAVARLLDKGSIVRDAFHGYATPAASPLATTEWLASDLEWIERDPVLPFLGTNARLNVDRARAEFERAGYRYSENGRLIEQ